jgi:hypothetical protein
MQRRDLLRALGGASAFALLPLDAVAAWSRVASGIAVAEGLSAAQLALVGAIADTILPRTDSPSATDVAVPAFVNVIVGENYTDPQRTQFLAGLVALDAKAKTDGGSSFADLSSSARGSFIESVEAAPRNAEPSRTYWRLKGLVLHGYFTSERVSKDVLHNEIMPGRFDGSAPMRPSSTKSGGDEVHHHA